jgi:hypothetical protein
MRVGSRQLGGQAHESYALEKHTIIGKLTRDTPRQQAHRSHSVVVIVVAIIVVGVAIIFLVRYVYAMPRNLSYIFSTVESIFQLA